MLRNGTVIVIIVLLIIGSGDQFPKSHTIVWKGRGKANQFYKGEQELYPSVHRPRVINRSSFRICRIHLHSPEETVKTA